MKAQLSSTDKFYHGLRILPSYDELLQSTKKPLRIPIPDRSAKWFGLSNYRSLMLDAAKKFNNYERLNLDYNESGAHLPLQAARVTSSTHDEAWDRIAAFNQGLDEQHVRTSVRDNGTAATARGSYPSHATFCGLRTKCRTLDH